MLAKRLDARSRGHEKPLQGRIRRAPASPLPRARVSRWSASENVRRYDWTAASGSVVGNDPVNGVDPTGNNVIIVTPPVVKLAVPVVAKALVGVAGLVKGIFSIFGGASKAAKAAKLAAQAHAAKPPSDPIVVTGTPAEFSWAAAGPAALPPVVLSAMPGYSGPSSASYNSNLRCSAKATNQLGPPGYFLPVDGHFWETLSRKVGTHPDPFLSGTAILGKSYWDSSNSNVLTVAGHVARGTSYAGVASGGKLRITYNTGRYVGFDAGSGFDRTNYVTIILSPPKGRSQSGLPIRRLVSVYPGC